MARVYEPESEEADETEDPEVEGSALGVLLGVGVVAVLWLLGRSGESGDDLDEYMDMV
jgi:hypothetical protein